MKQMQLTSLLERQEQDIIYSGFVMGNTSRTFVLVEPYRMRVGVQVKHIANLELDH